MVPVLRRALTGKYRNDDGGSDWASIEINIKVRPGTRRDLETLLHELMHCEDWCMSEKKVKNIAASQARLLWGMGWRLKQRKKT